VIGTSLLLALAQHAPRIQADLAAVEGVTPRLVDRYGRDLLATVVRGLERPEEELPVWPRQPRQERDPAIDARLAALKVWRKQRAGALHIDPGVLINNALLEALAREHPTRAAALEGFRGLKRWQRRVLGSELLAVLAK
jgi:ribonuclease D